LLKRHSPPPSIIKRRKLSLSPQPVLRICVAVWDGRHPALYNVAARTRDAAVSNCVRARKASFICCAARLGVSGTGLKAAAAHSAFVMPHCSAEWCLGRLRRETRCCRTFRDFFSGGCYSPTRVHCAAHLHLFVSWLPGWREEHPSLEHLRPLLWRNLQAGCARPHAASPSPAAASR